MKRSTNLVSVFLFLFAAFVMFIPTVICLAIGDFFDGGLCAIIVFILIRGAYEEL